MILQGRSISPGCAAGAAAVVHPRVILAAALDVPATGSPSSERERLLAAIGRACVQLDRMKRQLDRRIARRDIAIFDTHAGILRDFKFVQQIEQQITENNQSAEAAVARVVHQAYVMFAASKLPLVHDKAADLLDIGQRLLQCLGESPRQGSDELAPNTIIVAASLTPTELVRYAHQHAAAFVTETCGPKSHTAILARGFGIPFVTGLSNIAETVTRDAPIWVDADHGLVVVSPDDDDDEVVRAIQHQLKTVRPRRRAKSQPSVTLDGARIGLLLNISDATEADSVTELEADGVGLFRTEFLYMDRAWWPTEDESFADYQRVATSVAQAELNIRLADFGAEKCPSYSDIPSFRNPSLGLRGIRLLLEREDILRPQLKALARVGRTRPLTVLLPMLDTLDTLDTTIQKMCAILGISGREHLPFRLGTMVECPSAAVMIDDLIPRVDAVAIGLNDLTQYLLAVDRDDELVEGYHDAMQPSVLRLLRAIVVAADTHAKPVTVCGELAGDPNLTGLLLALGVRRFSVSRTNYQNILDTIRQFKLKELECLADAILERSTARGVRELLAERLAPATSAEK